MRLTDDNAGQVVGVPSTIPHETYMAAIRSLGIDPEWMKSITLYPDAVVCKAVLRGLIGTPLVDDYSHEVLTEDVTVLVVGGPT